MYLPRCGFVVKAGQAPCRNRVAKPRRGSERPRRRPSRASAATPQRRRPETAPAVSASAGEQYADIRQAADSGGAVDTSRQIVPAPVQPCRGLGTDDAIELSSLSRSQSRRLGASVRGPSPLNSAWHRLSVPGWRGCNDVMCGRASTPPWAAAVGSSWFSRTTALRDGIDHGAWRAPSIMSPGAGCG